MKTMEDIYKMCQDVQRELVFHDTVPIEEENIQEARHVAIKQKQEVLQFFSVYNEHNFTPSEVGDFFSRTGDSVLLTSIRRSITDLTKEGRLIKCDWSERRMGNYGKSNRTWKYNTEYVAPINPPPKDKEWGKSWAQKIYQENLKNQRP